MLSLKECESTLDYIAKERLKIATAKEITQVMKEYDSHLGRLQISYKIEYKRAEKREAQREVPAIKWYGNRFRF